MTHSCLEENTSAFHQCCSLDMKHLKTHAEPKTSLLTAGVTEKELDPEGFPITSGIHILMDHWGVGTLWKKAIEDKPLAYI